MRQLVKAAERERRAPAYWWFAVALAMGTALTWMVHVRHPQGAWMLAVVLLGAWVAPLLAFLSLSAPERARVPPPEPGTGSYDQWRGQARMLGRLLLYWEDNADLPRSVREVLKAARADLRDTLGAHPLRDDLERVCGRVREGAIAEMKRFFWREYRSRVRELRERYELDVAVGMEENERLLALKSAMENAAAVMVRRSMPRMLERERLVCARDCAWLATEGVAVFDGHHSPIELAGALVVEWCDFSEPWLPARMLRRALERLDRTYGEDTASAPWRITPALPIDGVQLAPPPARPAASAEYPHREDDAEPGGFVPPPGPPEVPAVPASPHDKPNAHRVRVRVRRSHRRHSRHYRGPSFVDILSSCVQWLRYSVRSWWLYR
jgi:hypothetical protein